MSKLKDFLSENKNRVIMLAAILVTIVIIFVLVAVLSGKNNTIKDGIKNFVKNTEKSQEEESGIDATEEITTLADEETIAMEDATADQEVGGIDDNVAENEVQKADEFPYLIKVNRVQNCITVYKKDKDGEYTVPYRAIICSTGKYVGDTPLGEFTTLRSYEWLLMVDGSYGQFAYRYYGSILFHSVPYFSKNKGDLEYKQFNKLGEAASLGCVRVCVRDAIWLIENCPVGTQVVVYDDETSPGPLGKPEMIKIPEDSPNRGWDPTDPDPENPWNSCKPEITVDSTVSIAVNKYSMDTIVERLGATATDTCGNDITDRIKAGGSVNFNKLGKNTLVLTVKDAIGKTDTKIITVVVENTEVTTAKPTTTKKPIQPSTVEDTTLPEEMTTLPEEETTGQEQSSTEQSTTQEQPTQAQPTQAQPTQVQPTQEQPTQAPTTRRTVTLKMGSSIRVAAGKYNTAKEIAKAVGCSAVYSDGTTISDASEYVAVSSGSYNLNKEGQYTITYRYTDGSGITSQDVSVSVQVYVNPVSLTAVKSSIEVTAGEYQKVTDIFSKMGLAAVDSRGKSISNAASQVSYSQPVDINTPGTYLLTLTLTDSYGVSSNELKVSIIVKADSNQP